MLHMTLIWSVSSFTDFHTALNYSIVYLSPAVHVLHLELLQE
jgi:hypothetical protein